jgi:hypothetical protein
MALEDALLAEIESKLGRALIPTYCRKAKAWDLFEAFVFSIILQAAIEEGAETPIEFYDTSGKVSSDILFRTSPGYINEIEKYTHALLKFPTGKKTSTGEQKKLEFEVHIGIYSSGSSGVAQECDVAVLLKIEGDRCRRIKSQKAVVKSVNILIGVECKCYQKSNISLGSGRSFLGLVQDLSSKGEYYFVFNGIKPSVEKLLSHYDKGWEHNLSPSSKKEVERLRYSFQNRFKYLKAKLLKL